ncbi:Bug family tripartite tricarboxylate transporter substrate binding protein [Variovorax sp. VNK109]|uniref:Bug family tripartite tricarboxylate transporter substrate binding protein n=1 Tax=Variovorax sp. VNK109 TaxID=3400919 RepID=UPI003C11918C
MKRRSLLLATGSVLAAPAIRAQAWPSRSLRMIAPYPAGGPTDTFTRAVADRLSAGLGQPVVVENKPGANTIIGANLAAKAAPDGYTLFMGSSTSLAVNPVVYQSLPYDPVNDFQNISYCGASPLVMVVPASLQARDLREFVELAKKTPAGLNLATPGAGGAQHLAGELFNTMAGISMVSVPFQGGAPALASVMAGQTQAFYEVALTAVPHLKAGRVRALGVTGTTRLSILPDVPTIAEQGFAGYEALIWYGVVAPRGVPSPIVGRLNSEMVKLLQSPEMRDRFGPLALDLSSSSPDEMTKLVAREKLKWGEVARAARVQLQA